MLSLCFLIKIWTLSFSNSYILNENTWNYIRNRDTQYISWRADNHKLLKIYSMIWCKPAVLTSLYWPWKENTLYFGYNCFSLYCMFPLNVHCREQVKYRAREVQSECVLFDMSHPCWRLRHIEYWQSFLLSQTQTDGKLFSGTQCECWQCMQKLVTAAPFSQILQSYTARLQKPAKTGECCTC